jgi:serine/threonine-protein kinase
VGGEFSALEHQTRRRECHSSALAIIRAAAALRPALLVFEDIDRYDGPSRQLVEELLEPESEAEGRGLVLLATRMPEPSRPVRGESLELLPLGEAEARELLRHALGESSAAQVRAVLEASVGLPLHVEQILRYIAEGGGEPYPNLSDTIGGRIARLPQEARTLLQAVALLGGEATESLLAAIEVGPLPAPVALLQQRGFTVAASGLVRIVHPLFADVAYAGIPEEARRALHARAWRALEAQKLEPAALGRHAYEARDRRAIPLLERAGERTQREFDDGGAAIHFRRAVELQRWALLEGAPEAEEAFVRLSVKLGESLYYSRDMVGAEGVLREALGYAQGTAQSEARVRLALARLYIGWDQLERGERELRAGLRVGFKAGDAQLLAELYLEFGGLCVRRGDLEAAIDELTEGINLCTGGEGAEAEVGPGVLWRLIARHAETLQAAGDTPAALAVARHALRHAQRVQSLVGEARVHTLFGQLHDVAGDAKLAATHRTQALDMMRRLGDRRSTAELLLADVQSLLSTGGIRRDTVTRLQEASQLAASVGWKEGVRRSSEALKKSSPPASAQPVARESDG